MAGDAPTIGAILGGGRSSRFGSDKRVAELNGVMLIERARISVQGAVDEVVLVTGDGVGLRGLDLPAIADIYPGLGPLAGVHAALIYARQRGAPGALVVGCDMPFLPSELLREIVAQGEAGEQLAVAAESGGRREVEPLCAWYSCDGIGKVEAALQASRLSAHTFLAELSATRLPLDRVRQFGEPTDIFRNVNSADDFAAAEAIARASQALFPPRSTLARMQIRD